MMMRLIATSLLAVLWMAPVQGVGGGEPVPDSPPVPWFGVVEAFADPVAAHTLGASWTRVRLNWAHIQPENAGQWIEADVSEAQIDAELAAGREVTALLIGIPAWARDDHNLPVGLYLPIENPDNAWAEFVRQAATRYRGRITRWVVWNEPDVWDESHPGYTWHGSEADFVRLLKVTYLVIKDVDPEAMIHLGAFSHWWDALYGRELYFRRFLDVLVTDPDAQAHDYYFDAATLHLYFNPADVYGILAEYQAIQAEYGLDKPFWLIETNAPPSSDPDRLVENPAFRVSLAEQAAYLPQAVALARAAGAERVAVYKLLDTPGDIAANPEPFGLVRPDGTYRPGLLTARVAADQLAEAHRVVWLDTESIAQVVAPAPDRVVRMLWSRPPETQQVDVPALSQSAQLTDMWGNPQGTLLAEEGRYRLRLNGAECQETVAEYCMIGGPVIYLVEDTGMVTEDLSALRVRRIELAQPDDMLARMSPRRALTLWVAMPGLFVALAAGSVWWWRVAGGS